MRSELILAGILLASQPFLEGEIVNQKSSQHPLRESLSLVQNNCSRNPIKSIFARYNGEKIVITVTAPPNKKQATCFTLQRLEN